VSAAARDGTAGTLRTQTMTADTRPRILFCETNVDGTIGGSYYSLLYLVKGLDRSRYRATVLFSTDHGLMPAFREAGAETIVWPPEPPFTFAGRMPSPLKLPALLCQKGLNFTLGYLQQVLARARFLRARDITIVHLNNSIKKNHEWMAAAALAGRICLTHERGINDSYEAAARFFGRRLGAIICISRAVHDNMVEHGAGFPNLVTIHNGLDPAMMQIKTAPAELRAAWGIDAAAPVIVMVGNIKQWKGQDTVVRAIDRVRRSYPSVRCLFVGDTSPDDLYYDTEVRALVATLGLGSNIIFTGYQRNVADFLMMSDVVVHASVLPEPFGRVILEAMACRKPVIGSRGGAITELVDEGQTGLTFTPGDSERLAEAIVRVIGDPAEAQRLGQNGYDRLIREFHVDRNVESTERLYERLLQTGRRTAPSLQTSL
jgi:glycosyltransferase involved in cell wall biosynthesis